MDVARAGHPARRVTNGANIMEVTLKLAGTKPLLLASIEAADPRSTAYQKMAELRRVKSANRTPAWHDQMEETQFLSAFYTIPDIDGVAIPAENVRQSLAEAAKASRDKPKLLRAVACLDVAVPLLYPGWQEHWTPAELYKRPGFKFTKMQRSSSGASPSTWPRFEGWAVSVLVDLDPEIMGEAEFWKLADRAGRIAGLGACRALGYGRYAVDMPVQKELEGGGR